MSYTPLAVPVKTVTANYTATAQDRLIGGDTTGGNITIALPAAASVAGQAFEIKKLVGANNLVIDPDGAELIDGAATNTMTVANACRVVRSTGTEWWIISSA